MTLHLSCRVKVILKLKIWSHSDWFCCTGQKYGCYLFLAVQLTNFVIDDNPDCMFYKEIFRSFQLLASLSSSLFVTKQKCSGLTEVIWLPNYLTVEEKVKVWLQIWIGHQVFLFRATKIRIILETYYTCATTMTFQNFGISDFVSVTEILSLLLQGKMLIH